MLPSKKQKTSGEGSPSSANINSSSSAMSSSSSAMSSSSSAMNSSSSANINSDPEFSDYDMEEQEQKIAIEQDRLVLMSQARIPKTLQDIYNWATEDIKRITALNHGQQQLRNLHLKINGDVIKKNNRSAQQLKVMRKKRSDLRFELEVLSAKIQSKRAEYNEASQVIQETEQLIEETTSRLRNINKSHEEARTTMRKLHVQLRTTGLDLEQIKATHPDAYSEMESAIAQHDALLKTLVNYPSLEADGSPILFFRQYFNRSSDQESAAPAQESNPAERLKLVCQRVNKEREEHVRQRDAKRAVARQEREAARAARRNKHSAANTTTTTTAASGTTRPRLSQ